jgi:glucose/arabinose dehydrogenase
MPVRPFLLLLVAAFLLAACGGEAQPTTAPTPPATATSDAAAPPPAEASPTPPAAPPTTTTAEAPPTATTAEAAPNATTAAVAGGPPVAQTLIVPDALRQGVFASPRTMNLPPAFNISVFAAGLGSPRWIVTGPDGRLWVTERGAGRVLVYDAQGSAATPPQPRVFAKGLNQPHGIAFYGGFVYVAETTRVLRIRNNDGQAAGDPEVIISGLPSGGHNTRTLLFTPDQKLLVSIGSSCNVCRETDERRAAVMIYDPDGSNGRLYATGLRNAVGLTLNPDTQQVWFTNNGRDNLGDNIPKEMIGTLKDGAFYGWPDCYGDQVVDKDFGGNAARCRQMTVPELQVQAHSAPLGLTFAPPAWPAPYGGNLIIAYHGSWNRSVPTGYKLVRVAMNNGQVAGAVADFLTGFQAGGDVWGRPVAAAPGADGALYVTDDKAGAIYRIFPAAP